MQHIAIPWWKLHFFCIPTPGTTRKFLNLKLKPKINTRVKQEILSCEPKIMIPKILHLKVPNTVIQLLDAYARTLILAIILVDHSKLKGQGI